MYVDVNAYAGRWPFRTVPDLRAGELSALLESEDIGPAYVSSIAAIFKEDPGDTNEELFGTVADVPRLKAVPVVNPGLGNWEDLVVDYLDRGLVTAIKIHPNFHGYRLRMESVASLARRLADTGTPLLIPLRMEDERFQNPAMQVPPVSIESVASLAAREPGLKVICCNAYRKEVAAVNPPENLFFDIAFVDWFKPIDDLLSRIPSTNILFGSHAPLFVPRAAVMKVQHADAPDEVKRLIAEDNARRLFRT